MIKILDEISELSTKYVNTYHGYQDRLIDLQNQIRFAFEHNEKLSHLHITATDYGCLKFETVAKFLDTKGRQSTESIILSYDDILEVAAALQKGML